MRVEHADCLDAMRELRGASVEGNPRKVATGHVQRTRNVHPTVKPIALMRWLVRLVTPPGGLVLDPFTGSGTTGCACALEGFDFLGFEREAEYVEIAKARVTWWSRYPVGTDHLAVLGEREPERPPEGQMGFDLEGAA
jgi:tRNA G10  N-methylase Trm11